MAHIRTWADIKALGGDDWLTPAEQQLIAACKAGERCFLGDGDLPPEGLPASDREVRAEVLRYLILGGCKECPVEDIGVWADGLHITGLLDLDFCTAKGALRMPNCRFDHRLDTEQTRFALVDLSGSHLNGWWAQGMVSQGTVFLRDITATATVYLNSATIGGQLDCEKAQFKATEGFALVTEGAKVTDSVFLNDITATATVSLSGATIGGQLACEKAQFKATEGFAFNAQGAKVTESVFLREVIATATVDLNGATIGGQLDCKKAQFKATEGFALNAQGAKVTSSVFLRDITATANVDLNGATIGGQLDCDKAQFDATEGFAFNAQGAKVTDSVLLREITATATVALNGAEIGGNLYCNDARLETTEGNAFNALRARISGVLHWRHVTVTAGSIDLNSAHAHALVDDPESWMQGGALFLNGFTYDRIYGFSDLRQRRDWLAKGSMPNGDFVPQPYTQYAKVLRETGHDSDARKVLAKREQLIRKAQRKEWRDRVVAKRLNYVQSIGADLGIGIDWLWDTFLLRGVVGYGYHPFRSVIALLALWAMATAFAYLAWEEGSFAPNSGPLLVSEGWQDFAALPHPANPAALWSQKGAPGQDWESFNRYAYAADLVIPIIDLGQTAAWAPSTSRQGWGWHLWWLRWVFIGCGWIITALGAAAITGIIRRD